jgi:hypothetical protein
MEKQLSFLVNGLNGYLTIITIGIYGFGVSIKLKNGL